MERLVNLLDEKISPIINQVADHPTLRMIRDALGAITPILMVGSLFVLIVGFPSQSYQAFLTQAYDGILLDLLKLPITFSYEMMAMYVVVSFALQISKQYEEDVFPLILVALLGYIMLTYQGSLIIFSARQTLLAAVISIVLSRSYIFVKHHLKETHASLIPPAVIQTMKNLLPYFAVIVGCVLMRSIMLLFDLDLSLVFMNTVQAFLEGLLLNYWGMLVIVFLIQLVWFFGLHGSRLIFSIFDLVLVPAMEINRLAFMRGEALPGIISKQFFDIFVSAGGTAIFGLILVLLLSKKNSTAHEIGKNTVWPACFNISEPIVFSLPIVLNYQLFLPYILAPMLCATLTYVSMTYGYVQAPIGIAIPWFIPSFIAGYLATLDVRAILLQGINIVVAMIIYAPFVMNMKKEG